LSSAPEQAEQAAKSLRDAGYTGRVALIGDESRPPYGAAAVGVLAAARRTTHLQGGAFDALGLVAAQRARHAHRPRARASISPTGSQ
jgi:hypothetical protein